MHLESKTKQKKVTKTTHQITELRKPRNQYNQTNHVNIIDGRLAISERPNFFLSHKNFLNVQLFLCPRCKVIQNVPLKFPRTPYSGKVTTTVIGFYTE